MARTARIPGESGYMHIITRGIGRQLLFEEEKDNYYYISLLRKYSEETHIKINAYCLMENHVHLLVFDESDNIAEMMKKIGVCYSKYFNLKYDRTGHLFQDRFKSENIDSEIYLLKVFRYILKNPQNAGVCMVSEYKWNSYCLYGRKDTFVDTSFLKSIIGDSLQTENNF